MQKLISMKIVYLDLGWENAFPSTESAALPVYDTVPWGESAFQTTNEQFYEEPPSEQVYDQGMSLYFIITGEISFQNFLSFILNIRVAMNS